MFIERLIISNFRCFGSEPCTIDLSSGLTAFIGANGAGKTAAMQALLRLFGVTSEQRRVRRQDFFIPVIEAEPARQRDLSIDAIIAFPELDAVEGDGSDESRVPEFFNQMVADDAGRLKCRLRLQATWTDDGSLDGAIDHKLWAIRTLGDFGEKDCIELKAVDRARIQMIYIPAARDGASQVTAFLRGRLWRAISWSKKVRDVLAEAGSNVNEAFDGEPAVELVTEAVKRRWQEIHSAGTDTTPLFRPIDLRFQEFIRKVEVVFFPDEAGRERGLEDLSDGQRSLFHLAMAAATLDVEAQIAVNPADTGFQVDGIALPSLTLIAVEEPENNLAPFYLSRIIRQVEDLTTGMRAQAVVSSHSSSILARVDPTQVRHFRLNTVERTVNVKPIRIPKNKEDASKFVREAVQTYPELYFARFVVLGEGASEEVVLPRIAEALGLAIDRSFVAVVPLGGRHVNHLWRLLTDLDIPHATLLDLDWGRAGGGWGRIKTVCTQLLDNGVTTQALFGEELDPAETLDRLAEFDNDTLADFDNLKEWVVHLQQFSVYFCTPLDLDYSMLCSFPASYQVRNPESRGPYGSGDPRDAVFGEKGEGNLYGKEHDTPLRWYRYLFLGRRGKPSTHIQILGTITPESIKANAPDEIRALLIKVDEHLTSSTTTGA